MGKFVCMQQKHTKSQCCQGSIYQHGQRRRQCSLCKRTWRIRQKKRGRKLRRINTDIVKRFLKNGSFNIFEHAQRLNIGISALQERIRKSRDLFLSKEEWPKIPGSCKLITVVDALIEKIDKQYYTVYFVALRSTKSEKAVILEPIIFPRYENKKDWQRVFKRIPRETRNRILALVGDGKPCLITITREYGWLFQRCHFHLLAELHRWASFKRRSKNRKLAEKLNGLVRNIITTKNEKQLKTSLNETAKLVRDPHVPIRIKQRFLKGFYRNFEFYRTYLNHSELNLPKTVNSCEKLCGFVRKFLNKTNGLRTAKSFSKWTKTLMLHQKKINCRGTNFPPR